MSRHEQSSPLSNPWRTIHGAIWIIGLGILFWKGWFWPGILILVGISAILEVVFARLAPPQATAPLSPQTAAPQAGLPPAAHPLAPAPAAVHRADLLPATCPKCGAPARPNEVRWTGEQSADCSYCGTNLPMDKK
jgi:hypothetical protein